ncbi:MAG: helix-hairpin-helix domain-containing protein [Gammaproteobacteria bacterium]|nr:helix-hairpin-helix domain-containing protein [Gammaproteobacteria bacterium]
MLPVAGFCGPVNINTADAATIAAELNGVGLKKAEAIVAYRAKNGAFKTAEDLAKVKGIGLKTVSKNRDNIVVK